MGAGTPPAVGRGVARDSWPPWVRAPPPAAVPGVELGSGRAAPSAEPGRSLHSALCPLLAAVSLPSAVLLPDSPGRGAGPPARLSRSAPRLGPEPGPRRPAAAPRAQTWARRSWAGAPGPATCTVQFEPGPGAGRSQLGAARRLHSLRGERGRETESGQGEEEGGRVGRWRRREGQRVPSSSLQPGPSRHPQLETSVGNGKGRAAGCG